MDYNRKELVDWVRGIYQNLDEADKQDALRFFPELRESEDERIRRRMLEHFKSKTKETWCNIPVEDILKWLEKQKEQEPNIELIQRTWYMEGYQDREHNLEPEWIVKTGEGGPRYEENPKYGQMLKKQKPVEWSEGDTRMLESALWHVKNSCGNGGKNSGEFEVYNWLKSLPERFNLQPKQEWSEGDDLMLQSVYETLYDHQCVIRTGTMGKIDRDYVAAIDKQIAWLKSLRPSWKPSELEKGALRTAIHILTDERNFPKAATQLQNILNAFEGKESRHDWKPSEEQMEALQKFFIEGVKALTQTDCNAINSIYLELKKL